jgi:hypothetical protein
MHFPILVAPSYQLTPAFADDEDAQVWWPVCLVAPLRAKHRGRRCRW